MSSVLFGVGLEDLTLDSAYDVLAALIDDGRRRGRTHQVTTVNVDFLVNSAHDPALKRLLQTSSLNVVDGMPLVWASSLFGTPIGARVAGVDLFSGLGAESARRGWKVHVLGGSTSVGERALEILLGRHPTAQITVDAGPIMADVADAPDSLIDDIAGRRPDILCVALGNPKQEYFIDRYRDRLGCPVMIGVGGSMDMLVGDRKRAPEWVQRVGAEWIVRAAQEPARLGPRYARDARVFVPAVLRHRRAIASHRANGVDLTVTSDSDVLRLVPAVGGRTAATTGPEPHTIVGNRPVEIDLTGVRRLTPRGHAALCSAVRVAQRFGTRPTVTGWSDALRDCLDDYATGEWLDSLANDRATSSPEPAAPPTGDSHSTHTAFTQPRSTSIAPKVQ